MHSKISHLSQHFHRASFYRSTLPFLIGSLSIPVYSSSNFRPCSTSINFKELGINLKKAVDPGIPHSQYITSNVSNVSDLDSSSMATTTIAENDDSSSQGSDSKQHGVATGSPRQRDLSGLGPKRFYKTVQIVQVKLSPANGGTSSRSEPQPELYHIALDGRTVKAVKKRRPIVIPSRPLAMAIAAEWELQTRRIRPITMPLTSLAFITTDLFPEAQSQFVENLLQWFKTDSVSFHLPYPSELAHAQKSTWGPIIDHLKRKHQLPLKVTTSLALDVYGEDVLHIARKLILGDGGERVGSDLSSSPPELGSVESAWRIAALDMAAGVGKSLAIAVSLMDGIIDAQQAVRAARVEEDFQSRVYGYVEGGHDLDEADAKVRMAAAAYVFRILQLDPLPFNTRS